MKNLFIKRFQIFSIFVSKSKLIPSDKPSRFLRQKTLGSFGKRNTSFRSKKIRQIGINNLHIHNMPSRKTDKSKRAKKPPIRTSLITILKRDKIIKTLMLSKQFEDFFSHRPGSIKHLENPLIISKSKPRQIISIFFCIFPELQKLFLFGLQDIFSGNIFFENGI